MNILFLTDKAPVPTSGGVERVVCTLSSRLYFEKNIKCICGYFHGEEQEKNDGTCIRLDCSNIKIDLSKIIKENDIEVIHSNVMSKDVIKKVFPIIRELKEREYPSLRHVFSYHSCPGYELVRMDLGFSLKRFFAGANKIQTLKFFLSQLFLRVLPHKVFTFLFRPKYRSMIVGVDKLVCLTRSNMDRFVMCLGIEYDKITYIGNPLSFDLEDREVNLKSNKVLMVCRLDEYSKRITEALDIWQMVEEDSRFDSWVFDIIGEGEDKKIYEDIIRKKALKRVSLKGRQPSLPYYKESSIVMVTSRFEGWSMAVLEAQETHDVVVGLRSDDFPALSDLIIDGEIRCLLGVEIMFITQIAYMLI